jgi:hypothetical protein
VRSVAGYAAAEQEGSRAWRRILEQTTTTLRESGSS